MTDVSVRGPDAVELLSALDINSYDGVEFGHAKQFMPCNPDGYTIGDGIVFCLGPEERLVIGAPIAPNWVQYHAETGEYDVTTERDGSSLEHEGSPETFRFQVQGSDAVSLMEAVTDGSLPTIPFFDFDELSIEGHTVYALRHSMSGEAGFELWGPYDAGDEVTETMVAADEEYGIRHLGTRACRRSAPMSGWVEFQLPAIYEFVGRDALRREVEHPRRTMGSLFWDGTDVVDVYASLFEDGETVGVSKWPTYNYNERTMLSLGVVDVDPSDPGTELTLVWGEEGSTKPQVERHVEREFRVAVGPVPPAGDRR